MHFHTNHMFCTRPCWEGKEKTMYWCRYLVSVERIKLGSSYYDTPEEDWTNLTEEVSFFDEAEYLRRKNSGFFNDYSDEMLRAFATKPIPKFKPEVIEWLNENVKDRRDSDYTKGWCHGNDDYLSTNTLEISLFFHRRSDAMAFIKRWSVYKKPTTYFDYFNDIRKKLNYKTNKLMVVDDLYDRT